MYGHVYRATASYEDLVINNQGTVSGSGLHADGYYQPSNQRILNTNTNTSAGISFPAEYGKKYKITLKGDLRNIINKTTGQSYYWYLAAATTVYNTSGSNNSAGTLGAAYQDSVTYDSGTNETVIICHLPSASYKTINITTSSIYYGTSNYAIWNLLGMAGSYAFLKFAEETPAGWRDIELPQRVSGAWVSGDAHLRTNGSWQ